MLLILSPAERRVPVFSGIVTIWALLGAVILFADALRLPRLHQPESLRAQSLEEARDGES